ncbi:twin-arginine translocase subunit TatC [Agaribacterium haliotis]|uniref:twin-arginine translocase subunit TatC n=1 Tax=Agaribacterium haliotis TaxID=2013869 RepID=UPI000BB5469C|nr:twin-arginine translocase subunit TatC [Agaribacterium haliotis]
MSTSSSMPDDDKGQPLVEHLLELRSCLLHALVAVLLVFLGLFSFANEIYEFIAEPLQRFLPESTSMIATDVAAPFLTPFKLTLFASIYVAMPYILYQIWRFVGPALYKKEKAVVVPMMASSIVLFYAGTAFAYFVVFPLVFQFFTSIGPESVAVMTDISSYLTFVTKLFFAFGIAFEIPIATILLIYAEMMSAENLGKKRPYVIVFCFVLGMLMTPPDVISQLLLAIPMWLLFEAGLFFGKLMLKRKQQRNESEHTAEEP